MKSKPIAVVLGGTIPHIALLENLKQRGYFTVLIDYFENPPAKKAADMHIQESTLAKEKVCDIAQRLNTSLVISTCIDQANVTACYCAEKLGLPSPYSYETALWVTNKILMKKKMIENDIPTSQFICIKDTHEAKYHNLKYPIIIKPTDSNSSKGVKKVYNQDDLDRYVIEALKISRSNEAIIEEYIEGSEIGIDCFIKNKEVIIVMTKERRKIISNNDSLQQIHGCIWPAAISNEHLNDLKNIASQIATTFNLDNTPLMIQAILNEWGINVIEFAPRIGGGESFRIIKLSTGFDIINAAVDSFLKKTITIDCKPSNFLYADNFIYTKPGYFGGIIGYKDRLASRDIAYIDSYKEIGSKIGIELTSNNRVGVFTVKSNKREELFKKITTTLETIDVHDTEGNSIMRKDIYQKNT